MGRHPTPIPIKKLQGNPSKRAIPENVPDPISVGLPCPQYLDPVATEEWARLVAEFGPSGMRVLAPTDRAKLELACVNYSAWRQADAEVRLKGRVIETTNGNIIQSPWVGIGNKAAEVYGKIVSELGGSPTARVRVRTVDAAEEDSLVERIKKAARAS